MKLVSLVSTGIDSPVATYILSKYIDNIILVHGDNQPFTNKKEIQSFLSIAKHLKKILPCPIKIYIIPHGNTLTTYRQLCNTKYTCIICKRMLLLYAAAVASKENAEGIIMGDSLGQVASQTLQNINVIETAVDLPILRPLIGLDKQEIIKIAKKIGTYELSIQYKEGCTAVPKKPATSVKLDQILQEEQRINVHDLVDQAIKKAQVISF